MTKDDAIAGVEKVRAMARDDEGAHSEEDALYTRVLMHIADGGDHGRELAKIALTTREIQFQRWCA